jgi:hypothetical protein
LVADLALVSGDHPAEGPMHWHVDERLIRRVPDASVRAGVAALAATIGAPLLDWLVDEGCPVTSIAWGDPGGRRMAGVARPADRPSHRVVHERYRHEHPFLATGPVLRELCRNPVAAGHAQAVLGHALSAVAHAQLLALLPSLVGTTELARRQQSLVLALVSSRPAGSERVRIVAPDGSGTLPGGAPERNTPDLWSLATGAPQDAVPAPATVALVLRPWLADPVATVDRPLVEAVDERCLDRWLPPPTLRAVLAALAVA